MQQNKNSIFPGLNLSFSEVEEKRYKRALIAAKLAIDTAYRPKNIITFYPDLASPLFKHQEE